MRVATFYDLPGIPVTPEQNINNRKEDKLVTTTNNRQYTWNFADGKLSAVSVTPDWSAIYKAYSEEGIARHPEIVPAFQEEADFLTQIYGKPSTAKAVPYHNAYGAQWERSELVWYPPDGTQIVAFERTGFNQQGQLELGARPRIIRHITLLWLPKQNRPIMFYGQKLPSLLSG